MTFLYKLSLLNENEIRNGLDPRFVYVAASSMDKAITRYSDQSSMISACEFLYPISVVSDSVDHKLTYDNLFQIVYRDSNCVPRSVLVFASDSDHAVERLSDFLSYSPDLDKVLLIEDLIL